MAIVDTAAGRDVVGGKAAHLFRLAETGRVPRFFVATAEDDDATATRQALEYCSHHEFRAPLAIRSSAVCEDGANASFPGVFESVLNVDLSGIGHALASVRRSVSKPRVRDYLRASGLNGSELTMHVIVQEMVDAETAGVCLTGQGGCDVLIEACWGLGEGVVSGAVEADRYRVSRTGQVCSIDVRPQKMMLTRHGWRAVPVGRQRRRKLMDAALEAIARESVAVEELLHIAPLDMEFAMADGSLFVLQARRLPEQGHAA
jgi:phosphoenolpyruvate synthase/pyruvate phosphate dikinase